MGYPRNSIGYYFYYPSETKVFVSRNATFLEKEFLLDRKGGMIELDEIREPPTTQVVEPTPQQPIKETQALRRSERISRPPNRLSLLLEEGQGEPIPGCDPRNFKQALSDADSSK